VAQIHGSPDITARICGICPVAYQMSSVLAMEDAMGLTVDDQIRQLGGYCTVANGSRAMCCTCTCCMPRIFLGYEDALLLAKDKTGACGSRAQDEKDRNDVMNIVGEGDPPGERPRRRLLPRPAEGRAGAACRTPQMGLDQAIDTAKLVSTFEFRISRRSTSSFRCAIRRNTLSWGAGS